MVSMKKQWRIRRQNNSKVQRAFFNAKCDYKFQLLHMCLRTSAQKCIGSRNTQ